jgi:hypothetical protein
MAVEEADWELTAAPEVAGGWVELEGGDGTVRYACHCASKMASSLFRGGLDFWKAFGLLRLVGGGWATWELGLTREFELER